MSLEPPLLIQAVLIGLAVGALSGGFGIGGGILATPLLRTVLHVAPHVAIGTSLLLMVPTAVAGALNYMRKDMVSLPLARACILPAVAGTIAGSLATLYLQGLVLMLLIALVLGLTGLDMVAGFGKRLKTQPSSDRDKPLTGPRARQAALVGLVCGFLSGLLGVGGGFLMVPSFLYLFSTPIKTAFGTSLLVVAAITVPGTLVHALEQHLNLTLGLAIILGSVPGTWLGTAIAFRLRESWLRTAFGFMLILLSVTVAAKELTLTRPGL